MNNTSLFQLIGTNHAMEHASRNEPWYCQCLACKFAKEYTIEIKTENGTTSTTFAEIIIDTLAKEGHNTSIPHVEEEVAEDW